MKKKRLICLGMVAALLLVGCGGSKKSTIAESQLVSNEEFTGEYIVNTDYVKDKVGDANTIFLDCRGADTAKKGTVKGAIATSWQELCTCSEKDGESGDETWGKIPEAADLSKRLSALGLSKDKEIIAFADAQNGWGEDGRILWELIAAGYTNVKMVNGGYAGIEAAGIETQKSASDPTPADVKVDSIDNTHVMETKELQDHYEQYVIVDTRTDDEYNGATKFGEAKGGHLPGAIQIRFLDLFKSDGTLISNADVEKLLTDAGIAKDAKIVTYCTGGIRSAYAQLVFQMCGYENTYNYDQSYWRWAVIGDVE